MSKSRDDTILRLLARDILEACWRSGQTAPAELLLDVVSDLKQQGWLFLPPLTARHVSSDEDNEGAKNG